MLFRAFPPGRWLGGAIREAVARATSCRGSAGGAHQHRCRHRGEATRSGTPWMDDGLTLADFLAVHGDSAVASPSSTTAAIDRRLLLTRQRQRRRPTLGASSDVVQALQAETSPESVEAIPPRPARVHVETYGCAMNVHDSQIVASLLQAHPLWFQVQPRPRGDGSGGERVVDDVDAADVVLLNTCAIREKAETRVLQRLRYLRAMDRKHRPAAARRTIGVLGCMAERLKTRLLEGQPSQRLVDLVVGPDAYRELPLLLRGLLAARHPGSYAYNVQLSVEETYADVPPWRGGNGVSAYVSITRGCDNHCAFCVVPQTRGIERSMDPAAVVEQVQRLGDTGHKEVVLLGQNVNSYRYVRPGADAATRCTFAQLLDAVCAAAAPYSMRVRFTSPHPKDFSDDVLDVYARHDRRILCRQLHVPLQSGSTAVLQRMRRGYTRDDYLALIERIRQRVGEEVALSTDVIVGFCGETEHEHRDTLSLMERVGFDQAFTFAYSERERTIAARTMPDDVPPATKSRRLRELIDTCQRLAGRRAARAIGQVHRVLVDEALPGEDAGEGAATRLTGRTEGNKRVLFTADAARLDGHTPVQAGAYVDVLVHRATASRLYGTAVSLAEP
ncbi:hypothetical protein CDCA_CDCA04G1408 [Cyanidium caldarium]|uniref:Uncharacterized protein n=1 Tax=Cyanidium caldarium TaxID=2771 RepID=A0AAV9IU56_CYACA|nr:hypothetical protein CDCA_CDCA04G1408 [Cyanidium caldarium]